MSQGLSLLDIAPQSATVKIGDNELAVYGLSVTSIIQLLQRFPTLQSWATSGNIDAAALTAVAPDAIAAVIALGCRAEGEAREAGEKRAAELPIEVQMDIIEAIGGLTFKNGFGPFAQRLVRVATAGSEAVSLSSGRGLGTTSPPQSSNSQPSGPAPETSGN